MEFSQKTALEFLERTQIEKIFQEQAISATQKSGMLPLGRLLGAGDLIVIETQPRDGRSEFCTQPNEFRSPSNPAHLAPRMWRVFRTVKPLLNKCPVLRATSSSGTIPKQHQFTGFPSFVVRIEKGNALEGDEDLFATDRISALFSIV